MWWVSKHSLHWGKEGSHYWVGVKRRGLLWGGCWSNMSPLPVWRKARRSLTLLLSLERIYIWCCSPQLSAVKLVMASQISTVWFDSARPKVQVETPNNTYQQAASGVFALTVKDLCHTVCVRHLKSSDYKCSFCLISCADVEVLLRIKAYKTPRTDNLDPYLPHLSAALIFRHQARIFNQTLLNRHNSSFTEKQRPYTKVVMSPFSKTKI